MATTKALFLLVVVFGTVAGVWGNEDEAPLDGFSKEDMESLKTINAEFLPPALKRNVLTDKKK